MLHNLEKTLKGLAGLETVKIYRNMDSRILNSWGGMGREMGWRFKREEIYVYLWLIHVEV